MYETTIGQLPEKATIAFFSFSKQLTVFADEKKIILSD